MILNAGTSTSTMGHQHGNQQVGQGLVQAFPGDQSSAGGGPGAIGQACAFHATSSFCRAWSLPAAAALLYYSMALPRSDLQGSGPAPPPSSTIRPGIAME